MRLGAFPGALGGDLGAIWALDGPKLKKLRTKLQGGLSQDPNRQPKLETKETRTIFAAVFFFFTRHALFY